MSSLKDTDRIHSIIEKGEIEHNYFLAENENGFLDVMEKENIDIIISDYSLHHYDGNEALKVAKEKYPFTPFIFLSGVMGEDAAINAMLNGATDYVLKNKPERLLPAIRRAMYESELENKERQAEQALAISETRYRRLFESAKDGILILDAENGMIMDVNPFLIELLGYSKTEFIEKAIWEIGFFKNIVANKDKFSELQAKEYIRYENLPLETADGRKISVEFVSNVYLVDNHKVIQCNIRDITMRKRAEEDLIIAKNHAEESDRLKSAFLANMSHEIRTPMNGILGFAELLKEPNLTGEEQQQYIRIIEKSGARMLNIINDIITISKVESGNIETIISETNVNEQIEFIYNFFRPETEQKDLQFCYTNALPAEEAVIQTDREKLYAILTNLVKNAIKYTQAGSVEFGYVTKDNFLEFYVKDTGEGICQGQNEIIFQRFRQGSDLTNRYNEGSGLGLSISKAYVEMIGGKIWVESQSGKGSVFYFSIPYSHQPKKHTVGQDVSTSDENNQINNLKILIAEDDETSELFLKTLIKKISSEVYYVKTGDEAIEACRLYPDMDLVLMDIRMPGLNGYEATRQIRQFNKQVIIIAQTAYGLSGEREKAMQAGCNDYISKPINRILLLDLIEKHFN